MKSKKTNILLGIIAVNLTLLTLIQLEIWPTKAKANELELNSGINYGLVPLNENGSINVNLSSSSAVMDVNLMEVGGVDKMYVTDDGTWLLGVYDPYK